MSILKSNPLYCELFVDAVVDKLELNDFIASIINGSINNIGAVVSAILDISVDNNEFFNSPKYGEQLPPEDAPNSYLYYRYRIDIEPASAEVSRTKYTRAISDLVKKWCGPVLIC